MKVLITAGPTREPIDAVRFISNASSGKMGLALAKESIRRGYKVTLVLGPIGISAPEGAKVINVITASEMLEETLKELKGDYDALISAAAISDYTPMETIDKKLRSGEKLTLKLKSTRKLITCVRERFPRLFIVAFKAEYGLSGEELIKTARGKLRKQKANLIVANDIKKHSMGDDNIGISIVGKDNGITNFEGSKQEAAKKILDLVRICLPSP